MTDTYKHQIASSFPNEFDQTRLDMEISYSEYKIFENGIFSKDMNDRWNVFVLDDILYIARSWTGYCIFKIFIQKEENKVILSNFHVNRDNIQYYSFDVEHDAVNLKYLLYMFLKREDFYSDPKFELPLIKSAIENVATNNEYIKTIGTTNVGLALHSYESLNNAELIKRFDVSGWEQLNSKLINKNENEPLICLYLHHFAMNSSMTFYFDKEVKELLGQIKKTLR